MDVLFPQEEKELNVLVCNANDKDIIKLIIINFPVAWDTIREMLMSGWSVSRISAFCKEMHFKGKIISDVWDSIKWIDSCK